MKKRRLKRRIKKKKLRIKKKEPPHQSHSGEYGEWETKRTLLVGMLELAVPMWFEQVRNRPWNELIERAKICSQYIAEHGDEILFKVKGKTRIAFNHLAEGIAILSMVPGGVKIFGAHFENKHTRGFHVPKSFRGALLEMLERLDKAFL